MRAREFITFITIKNIPSLSSQDVETQETDMNSVSSMLCVTHHGKYLIKVAPASNVTFSLCLQSDHGVRALDVLTLYSEPDYYCFCLKASSRQSFENSPPLKT